jgi:hypothetical protein
MAHTIHRDAISAWEYLRQHGGIELDGRDQGLDEEIRKRLNPFASTLDEALSQATLEQFAQAFFKSVHSFLTMFRDILAFFEQARAAEGKDNWTLRLDNFDLSLEHFRQSIETWGEAARIKMDVPALNDSALWQIWQVLSSNENIKKTMQGPGRELELDLPTDVKTWVAAYKDRYLPLPKSLLSDSFPAEMVDVVTIIRAALLKLIEAGVTTRDQLRSIYRARRVPDRSDALDFWMIAQNETDSWLQMFVTALSAAATKVPQEELQLICKRIKDILDGFPRKPVEVEVHIADLESVLSLPIWDKRNELYSVWIATEIVKALNGHDVELHHDQGRITFAFKETDIATIHSSPGPFKLISERWSPLADPHGEGRTGGVQPDHGLWTFKDGTLTCRLSIEVKHYKNSARQPFVDVLDDYSRAFPEGNVYLVSHGPVGDILKDLPPDLRERCHVLRKLRAENLEGRQTLARAVRECVGEPIVRWPAVTTKPVSASALVFDVSGSMKPLLKSAEMNVFVRGLVSSVQPKDLIAVDESVVGSWSATEDGYAALLQSGGGSTMLENPLTELRNEYKEIVVVTDGDGLSTIKTLPVETHPLQASVPHSIKILVWRS